MLAGCCLSQPLGEEKRKKSVLTPLPYYSDVPQGSCFTSMCSKDASQLEQCVPFQHTLLFLLAADTLVAMTALIEVVLKRSAGMDYVQLNALAAELSCRWGYSSEEVRVSLVVPTSTAFRTALLVVQRHLTEGVLEAGDWIQLQPGVVVGYAVEPARIGFVFPGQGSQQRNSSAQWIERYEWAKDLLDLMESTLEEYGFPPLSPVLLGSDEVFSIEDMGGDSYGVSIKTLHHALYAQLVAVLTSMIGVEFLRRLGICPAVVAGHSVGELAALAEAGAMQIEALIRLVAERAQSMGERGAEEEACGGMVSLMCSETEATDIVDQVAGYLTVACVNSDVHVVLAGERHAIQEAIEIATLREIKYSPLFVENAFHSRLMAHTAEKLRSFDWLNHVVSELSIPVISGVDGGILYGTIDLNEYCAAQVMLPVRFVDVVRALAKRCDIVIEVGSGKLLSTFIAEQYGMQELPVLPIQSIAGVDSDLQCVVGMLFAMGHTIHADVLYTEAEHLRSTVVEKMDCCDEAAAEEVVGEVLFVTSMGDLKVILGLPDVSDTVLLAYLKQRGSFIGQVILADIKT